MAAAALVTGLAVAAAPFLAGEATAQDDDGAPNISVSTVPRPSIGICAPAATALSQTVRSDADSFTMRITVAAPLCDPIDVVAAIYRMPAGGGAWPQRLAERTTFRLEDAAVTTVRFTKTCEPVQFDVLTGATPEEIAPWGEVHGPLLFPDVNTSLQHFGYPCEGSTTTTTTTSSVPPSTAPTSSTTSTTTTTTTTTTQPEVLNTAAEGPTTTEGPHVLGATVGSGGPSSLAFTGWEVGALVLTATTLVAGGLLLDAIQRRLRRA